MLLDCFSFLNEEELLEVRLNEHNDFVDWFVITESNKTFSGKNRECKLQTLIADKFQKFAHKIIIARFNSPEFNTEKALNEKERFKFHEQQKNFCKQVINHKFNLSASDYILISDLDEILKKEAVQEFLKKEYDFARFELDMFHHFFNLKREVVWYGPFIIRADKEFQPYTMRHSVDQPRIKNAGWHFSYFGSVDQINEKIASIQEIQFQNKGNTENINNCLQEAIDVLGRPHVKLKFINFDNSFPNYVIENRKKFSKFIKDV